MAGGIGDIKGTLTIDSDLKGLKAAESALGGLGGRFDGVLGGIGKASAATGKAIGVGLLAGSLAVGALGASSVEAAATFQAGMSNIKAVSGATTAEMETVRAKAMQIGADTAFSAQEAAMGMEELLKAGVSVDGVLHGAADAAIALASAGGVDLPTSAAIASAAMNNFGLSSQELPKVADLIAGAANASAISVEDFGYSLSASGAVANLAGVSFDDLAVAITAMGNAGIKGSDAGTSLKTFMSNLTPTTKVQTAAFKELGLWTAETGSAFYDATGSLKPMSEVAQILQGALAGLTKEQQQVSLEALFGADAIRAGAVIAGQGAEGWNELAASMGKITAADVAATRLDNFAGSVDAFKGSVETVQIKLGEKLLPTLRLVVDAAGAMVNALGMFIDGDAAGAADAMSAAFARLGIDLDPSVFTDLFTAVTDGMHRIQEAFSQVDGDAAAGGLASVITKVVDVIVFLVENPAVAKFGAVFLAIFAAIAPIMAVLGPLIPLVASLGTAFVSLMGFLAPAGVAVTGIGSALGVLATILTGPVGLAIAAIIGAFVLWQAKGDEIQAWLSGFGDKVRAFFSGLADLKLPDLRLESLFGGGKAEAAGASAGTGFAAGLRQAISGFAASEAPGLFERIADGLRAVGGDETPPFLVNLASGFSEFQNQISTFDVGPLDALANTLGTVGEKTGSDLLQNWSLTLGDLSNTLAGYQLPPLSLGGLLAGLPELSGNLQATFEDFFQDGDLQGLVSEFIDSVAQEWLGLPDAIVGSLQDLGSRISEPFQSAVDSLRTLLSDAWLGFQTDVIAPAQQAIFDFLHDQWMAIPEDIRADLVLIAQELVARFDEYLATVQEKTAEIRADIQARFDEARAAVETALAEARAIVQREFDEIVSIVSSAVASVRARFGEIASGVEARIEAAKVAAHRKFDELRAGIESRLDAARQVIESQIAEWRAVAEAKVAELVAAAHAAFDPIVERVREIADRAVAALRSSLERAREAVLTPIQGAVAGISALVSEAVSTAQRIGASIIDGIVSGLQSARQAVVDAILGIARGSLDAIKDFLGINSPAKRLIPYGMSIPEGLALGIVRATPLAVAAVLAMGQAVAGAASEIEPFTTRDFFLVDEAAERDFLAASLAQLDQLEADLNRARALVDDAKVDINAAFAEFFTTDPSKGGLAAIVDQIERLSGSKLGEDFFTNAGLDAASFDDVRRQIAALSDDPKQQEELWKAMIDGLTQRWKAYYDERLDAEEEVAKAAKKQLDATKRQISDAKKADKDADTSGLELVAAAQEAALQEIQDRIDALKDQNDTVTDSLKEQTFEVGNQFDRYDRLAKLADQRAEAEERARREMEKQVEAREDAALDAEKQASDQALDLLDQELEIEERNHEARLKFIDAQIDAEKQGVEDALAAEEERHAQALANITSEVEGRQAALDAELKGLDRAKNILDAFAAGNALTADDADFLRSIGLDPEQLNKSASSLEETTKQVDALQELLSRLDKGSSKRITKDEISATERDALQKLLDSGQLTDQERRRASVALNSKGGISQKQLAALLERAVGKDKGNEGFLAKQLEDQEAGIDLLNKEIERRETKAKVQQDTLDLERAGLQGLIDAENRRFEDFQKHAGDRLAALEAERDAEDEAFKARQDHLNAAKQAEKDRHEDRVKQLQEEYALELLRLGKTEDEVKAILALQRERAAAIAEEARKRAEEAKAAAAAAESTVTNPGSASAPPPAKGEAPITAPAPIPVPIDPILPPGTLSGWLDKEIAAFDAPKMSSFLTDTLSDAVELKSVANDLAGMGFKFPNNFTVNQSNVYNSGNAFTARDVIVTAGDDAEEALLDALGRR